MVCSTRLQNLINNTLGQDIKNFLSESHADLWPWPQKGSNKQFTKKYFFKISDLVYRSARAAAAGKNID